MKGKRLYALLSELDKKEHRQLVNQCRNSTDKRHKELLNLLRQPGINEIKFTKMLDEIKDSYPMKASAEKDRYVRRFNDFCCKEIENLLLRNLCNENMLLRNKELSNLFDKRNREDLTGYYNSISISEAKKSGDVETSISQYDIRLRWHSRNQYHIDFREIGNILKERKRLTEERYYELMAFYHTTLSGLYLDNPSDKHLKSQYTNSVKISGQIDELPNASLKIKYMIAEIRFDFFNHKILKQRVRKALLCIDQADLKTEDRLKLRRSVLYLQVLAGIYYGYPLNHIRKDVEEIFEIMKKYKYYDSISFFFLNMILILQGEYQRNESLMRNHKTTYFKESNKDYPLFLSLLKSFHLKEYSNALKQMGELPYSDSPYISLWSRLIEINVHMRLGNIKLVVSLIDRAKRQIKKHSYREFIIKPASLIIRESEVFIKTGETAEQPEMFQLYKNLLIFK